MSGPETGPPEYTNSSRWQRLLPCHAFRTVVVVGRFSTAPNACSSECWINRMTVPIKSRSRSCGGATRMCPANDFIGRKCVTMCSTTNCVPWNHTYSGFRQENCKVRGLVHLSAQWPILCEKSLAENMDLSPSPWFAVLLGFRTKNAFHYSIFPRAVEARGSGPAKK